MAELSLKKRPAQSAAVADFGPEIAGPRQARLAALSDSVNDARPLQRMAMQGRVAEPPLGIMQFALDEAARKELERLKALSEGPDAKARSEASALYKKDPTSDERIEIGQLVAKFSAPSKAAASGASASVPKQDWAWTKEQATVAQELAKASEMLYGQAAAAQAHQKQILMQVDPREWEEPDVEELIVMVRKDYFPGQSFLEWANLYKALTEVKADSNELHRINFFFDGKNKPIQVYLSTHNYEGKPDYLVHDSNAKLMIEGGQIMTAYDSPEEHRVSYAKFAEKIEAVKTKDGVTDAQIAQVMELIIKNPGNRPDRVPEGSLQLFTELVTTWMLAESVRHRSAMLSSMLELRLIARGQRTFAQALGVDDAGGTHPMSQGHSLKQGRTAEAQEGELLKGKTPKTPPTKVLKKQVDQLLGTDAAKVLQTLLGEYMPDVSKAIVVSQSQSGGGKKSSGDVTEG